MPERDYQPRQLEVPPSVRGGEATNGEPQTTSFDTLKALVERKPLKFATPQKAYDMLFDVTFEAFTNPTVPEPLERTIHNVALAFGFLTYDDLKPSKQALFLARLDAEREQFQINQLELTPTEATVLQQIAEGVNINYDPGTETTPEQRIFPFYRVEQRPPEDLTLYTMMTGREKLPEHAPRIVDSNQPSTPSES